MVIRRRCVVDSDGLIHAPVELIFGASQKWVKTLFCSISKKCAAAPQKTPSTHSYLEKQKAHPDEMRPRFVEGFTEKQVFLQPQREGESTGPAAPAPRPSGEAAPQA